MQWESFSSPFTAQLEYDLVFFDNQFVAATSDGLLSWDGNRVRPMNAMYTSLPPLEYWELVLSHDSSALFLFSTSTYMMRLDRSGRVRKIPLKSKKGNAVFPMSGAKVLNGFLFVPIKGGVLMYSGSGLFLGSIIHPLSHAAIYPLEYSNGTYFFLDNKGVIVFENNTTLKASYYPHKLQVKDKYKHKLVYFSNTTSLFFRIESDGPTHTFSFSTKDYRSVGHDTVLLKSRTNSGIIFSDSLSDGFLLGSNRSLGRSEQFINPVKLTSYLGDKGRSRYVVDGYSYKRVEIPSSRKLLYSNDTCFIYQDASRVFMIGNVEQNKTLGYVEEPDFEAGPGFLLGSLFVLPGPKWYVFPVRSSDSKVKPPIHASIFDFALGGKWSFDVSSPLEIVLGQPKSVVQGKESLVVEFSDAFGYVYSRGNNIQFLFFQATLPGLFYFIEENQHLTLTLQDENSLRSFCISKPEGMVLNSSIQPQEEKVHINYRPLVQYYLYNGFTLSLELGNRLIVRREGEALAAIQLPSERRLLSAINYAGHKTRVCFAAKDFVLCIFPYAYPYFSYQPLNGAPFFSEAKTLWVRGDTLIFGTKTALHNVHHSSLLRLEQLTEYCPVVRGANNVPLDSSIVSMEYGDSLSLNARLPFFLSTLSSNYVLEIPEVSIQESKNGMFNLRSVPPGFHKVYVWASLSDLRLRSSSSVFWLKVNPPWYRSSAFWFVVIFCALLGSFLFFRYLLRLRTRKIEQLNRFYELELIAYQKALNPHFVFNSLNTVYSLVNSGKNEKAAQFLVNFSRLLRGFLENLRSDLIELDKELSLVQSYHQIHQDRFPDSVELVIETKLSTSEMNFCKIPAGLLQIFVENCLEHAFTKSKTGNEVRILISEFNQTNQSFQMEIVDNGIGIKATKLKAVKGHKRNKFSAWSSQKETSFGLKMIEERLHILKLKHEISIEIDIFDRSAEIHNETGTRVLIEITYGK